ncbi:MAG: endonuclease [Propionibacteriales bacterium]|nr:endonuclease [Propionibacteriales bacterium]
MWSAAQDKCPSGLGRLVAMLLPDPADDELQVMSFNLRYADANRPNSWAERRPAVRQLLQRERPHLIGTQEGLDQQLRDIEADQGGHYRNIGLGREGGRRGEFMMVLYDWRRLDPIEHGHYWLSDSPDIVGSMTWDGGWPRMVTWIRFADRRTEAQFYAVNTHLEVGSAETREKSARLLRDRLRIFDTALPVLVFGDFNEPPAHPVHDLLVGDGPLVDSWDTAGRQGEGWGTFTDYRPPTLGGERIDWILTSPDVVTVATAVNTYRWRGQYPSDHLPVQALLRLPAPAR